MTNKAGKTCCEQELCVHEFFKHKETDIPWWACFEEACKEHYEPKIRNGTWPQMPMISLLKAQECPCLRRGCLCNFSNDHPFQEHLVIPQENNAVVEDLKETIRKLEENQERDQKLKRELKKNIASIKMTGTTGGAEQIDVEVKVGNASMMAIIDCGADVDYINEKMVRRERFPSDKNRQWMD